MGLIKAALGAAGGALADTWKEFFYCEALSADVLVAKGQKKTSGRSSNTKGNDNIITNGSGIAVADGQCMIIVDQGKVVEVCAEPGEFTYDTSTEPSLFGGSLGDSIMKTFSVIGKRITYGGDTAKDQRIYYFNTKEIVDNKFGTATPIMFRVVDKNIGLDLDTSVRCNGIYSYRIIDPILFYTNVCGNVEKEYTKDEIDSQLRTEFVSALQPAFAAISEQEIRPSQIPAHSTELCDLMNKELTAKWSELRGIAVVSIAMNPVSLPDEDAKAIKDIQTRAVNKDERMAAATMTGATAAAMEAAAKNTGGAMTGFMGMGMAQQAGGINAGQLFNMAAAKEAAASKAEAASPAPAAAPAGDTWKCPSCGTESTGNFCKECGTRKPEERKGWTCPKCGSINQGKFCTECGEKKPADAPLYKCNKCGWEPEDPHNPPKFCPQCGDAFDENDIQ